MIISLVGYMASGKSTVGKRLAEKLSKDFIDLDDYIENKEQITISEIFKKGGEILFREIEHKYLCELLEKENDKVISLGGGTPCYRNNMEIINKKTQSIYLKASVDVLFNRLIKESEKRPLVASVGQEAMPAFIEKHLNDREQYYSKANFIISADQNLTSIVREITLKLKG